MTTSTAYMGGASSVDARRQAQLWELGQKASEACGSSITDVIYMLQKV